ncbi:hypothetical protein BDW69DRAFT_40893 [Aspergillus filifer]
MEHHRQLIFLRPSTIQPLRLHRHSCDSQTVKDAVLPKPGVKAQQTQETVKLQSAAVLSTILEGSRPLQQLAVCQTMGCETLRFERVDPRPQSSPSSLSKYLRSHQWLR